MVGPASRIELRRTDENAAEINALIDRFGGAVGVEGVIANLSRQARPTTMEGSAVTRAYAWEERDNWDPRWWPQGITWSTDVSADQGVVVTSAYAKNRVGLTVASRITVVDLATLRYRHVLLVSFGFRGAHRVPGAYRAAPAHCTIRPPARTTRVEARWWYPPG